MFYYSLKKAATVGRGETPRNNDFRLACKGTRGKKQAAAVKEIKSAAALEGFHYVLLDCNCNISKRTGEWLHKFHKKVAFFVKKKPGRTGHFWFIAGAYCGAERFLFYINCDRVAKGNAANTGKVDCHGVAFGRSKLEEHAAVGADAAGKQSAGEQKGA